jgi:hypothetical protein
MDIYQKHKLSEMKKLIIMLALIVSCGMATNVHAQVSVHFNVGLQPLWGPTGYDYVQYYYIPDIDAYYDVPDQEYVYFDDGRWVTSPYLPPRYRDFDLYRAHKVVINEPSPWYHHDRYHRMYSGYSGRYDQPVIRDSREYRYYQNPNHPMHGYWRGGHDEGRHEGEWRQERPRDWGGNRGGEGWHGNEGHGHEGHGHEGHEEHEHGRH